MNQPKDAFHQVKAILGKLDRSITEARSKRLGEVIEDEPTSEPKAEEQPAPARREPASAATQADQPVTGYARMRAKFGRAKAVKPANGEWNSNGNH